MACELVLLQVFDDRNFLCNTMTFSYKISLQEVQIQDSIILMKKNEVWKIFIFNYYRNQNNAAGYNCQRILCVKVIPFSTALY